MTIAGDLIFALGLVLALMGSLNSIVMGLAGIDLLSKIMEKESAFAKLVFILIGFTGVSYGIILLYGLYSSPRITYLGVVFFFAMSSALSWGMVAVNGKDLVTSLLGERGKYISRSIHLIMGIGGFIFTFFLLPVFVYYQWPHISRLL